MENEQIDLKFEIDFIISLIALIISVTTLKIVKPIGIFFPTLGLGIFHIILLSLIYSLPKGLVYFPTKTINNLIKISKGSLFILIISFIFLMMEILTMRFTEDKLSIVLVPSIIVVILGLTIIHKTETLQNWNKLSLLVNPLQIRVYDRFEEDYQLLIKVTNQLNEEVNCILELIIPFDIIVRIDDNDTIRNKHNISFTLRRNEERTYHLFLRSERDSDSIEELKVNLIHKFGTIKQNAGLYIRN